MIAETADEAERLCMFTFVVQICVNRRQLIVDNHFKKNNSSLIIKPDYIFR